MSYVLLQFESNWADEMDVAGFLVVTRDYWDKARARLLAIDAECHLCVGTNEYINWGSGAEVVDDISETNLTDAEVAFFRKHFPVCGYGGEDPEADTAVVASFGQTGFLDNIGDGEYY